MNIVKRIHDLCLEQIESLYSTLEKMGAKVSDGHGRLVPRPKTNEEKIAFAAGQLTSALVFRGATMWHNSNQLFVFERQGNSQKFAISALSENDAQNTFQKYLDEHNLPGEDDSWRDYWRMSIAGKVGDEVFSLGESNV